MTKCVSFWIFNGTITDRENETEASDYLLITLAQGESFEIASGGPCDEGYHRKWTQYTYDDAVIVCETETDSRDCDGRFQSSQVHECSIGDLRAFLNPNNVPMPRWTERYSGQRDHAAEAMGY